MAQVVIESHLTDKAESYYHFFSQNDEYGYKQLLASHAHHMVESLFALVGSNEFTLPSLFLEPGSDR